MLRTIVFAAPVAVSTVAMPSVLSSCVLFSAGRGSSAEALHGKVPAQGVAFPILGKENPPQLWMPLEADAKKIEDLALHPIGARPNGSHGFDRGVGAKHANPDTHFVPPWKGGEVILQLEARFQG